MVEEESYGQISMSDMVNDSEAYLDTENHVMDGAVDSMEFQTESLSESNTEINTELDSELVRESTIISDRKTTIQAPRSEVVKSTRLPIGRIKSIMKMDPDVNIIHQDAAFLVTKATELFLETMAKETYSYLPRNKKTINKKELDAVINKVDCLCFLEGAMDF